MAADREQQAQREAAAWFGRLRSRSVATDELTEFARWRRDPVNKRAYEQAEALWDGSADLDRDADIEGVLRQAMRRRGLRRWLGRVATDRATLTVAASVGALAVVLLAMPLSNPWADQGYRTGVGERSVLRLADGTQVRLDTSSRLVAHVDADRRRVDLAAGQAYFDVHHDPAHPFVVDIGDGATVTALGTRFDVRRDGGRAAVSLFEGSIAVAAAGATVRLSPGQSVVVADGLIGAVAGAAGIGQPPWVAGRLSFRDTPLDAAIAEVNRYTTRPVRLVHAGLAGQPVSGDFSADDPDGFVAAANAIFGSGAVRRELSTD